MELERGKRDFERRVEEAAARSLNGLKGSNAAARKPRRLAGMIGKS
jgi:hypothetical protein